MLLLISLLSFLLPTQLGYHFNFLSTSVYGFKIDYLTPILYLTDIVTIFIIMLGIKNIKFNKKNIPHILGFVFFALINIFVSNHFIASLYKWLKITELLLLGIVIINTKIFDVFKHFLKPISYMIIIACLLGIFQYFNKGSLNGIFYWLGERNFRFSDPNVSPMPYAMFSHPNSFAGFLLVFGIFLLQFKKKFNQKYYWLLLSLIIINIILINSLNIYLTIFCLAVINFKNNFSTLMFIDFTQRTFTYRIELIKASLLMIKEHLLFGVGLNNFIPNLVKVSSGFVNAWELQPVHNIFLLVFSETGIFGLIAFCLLFSTYSLPLIAILITGLSDHYWLTLQQNLLLFTYVVVISKLQK